MGARLRKAKKDNKGIGGKGAGKLTDEVINELSLFYGLAIRRNPDSVKDMKRDVWATYYHKISTNKNPQHMNCSPGSSSWCKWQKAVADGTIDEFDHENSPLNDDVLKVIKPIYESLSTDTLLERCLGSETQNNNESLNSLIWTFTPKYIHAGTQTIQISTFLAMTKRVEIMHARTPFFLAPPTLPAHNFVNFEFFSKNWKNWKKANILIKKKNH
ncbi:uncharacterized protein LOC126878302 isoform X4 [Bombus huntii]|uniref:uncharacterized protein LOC126878302 isoform X4 n=1 Tax=Bombus huntii TaxID=85661 RepID=UPI0021A9C2D4|nr:uncharacterized protein LOC126878302 isoform X4 [Bombus huntii]